MANVALILKLSNIIHVPVQGYVQSFYSILTNIYTYQNDLTDTERLVALLSSLSFVSFVTVHIGIYIKYLNLILMNICIRFRFEMAHIVTVIYLSLSFSLSKDPLSKCNVDLSVI